MSPEQALQFIEGARLVPVVRAPSEKLALEAVDALAAGGVKVFEITFTVPNAAEVIRELTQRGDQSILVGAGTVLDRAQAKQALDAGSQFVVTPALVPEVVQACQERSVACAPGILTPSELVSAKQLGAQMFKVFPCSALGGASYLKALKGPFPDVKLLPTGGVSLDNARDFLKAGACAVGVGSNLVDIKALQAEGPEALASRAREFLKALE